MEIFKRYKSYITLFIIGALSLSTQVASLRELMLSLTGNEILIGVFYSSWLFAVILGATASLKFKDRYIKLFSYIYPFLALLTFAVFSNLRPILSVSNWEEISLIKSIAFIFLSNLPFGIIGATLFVRYINIAKQKDRLRALSYGYCAESLGSVLAGIVLSTLLLFNIKSIFVLFAFGLAFILHFKHHAKSKRNFFTLIFACIYLACSYFVYNSSKSDYDFAIETPYQELAINTRHSNLELYSNSKIVSAYPNRHTGDSLASLIMSQSKIKAKNILVSGLGQEELIKSLLSYEADITYHIYDKDYLKIIFPKICQHIGLEQDKFVLSSSNLRKILKENSSKFDAIIINHNGPSSMSSNRYYSDELFSLAKTALRAYGRIVLALDQEENFLDKELSLYGSSLLSTLDNNFHYSTVIPGKTHYFFASDIKDNLSTKAQTLSKRYLKIKPDDSIYNHESFYSLLEPNRLRQIQEWYRFRTLLSTEDLINTDQKPSSYILNNLVAMRRNNIQSAEIISQLLKHGKSLMFFLLFCFTLIRLKDIFASHENKDQLKHSNALLFQALSGFSAIASYLILLYFFQIKFSQLYSCLGYLSAAYMAGLSTGAIWIKNLSYKYNTKKIFYCLVLGQIIFLSLLTFIPTMPLSALTIIVFILLTLIAGVIGGASYPTAESLINKADDLTTKELELYDYLGACLAGISISLFLIPFLGINYLIIFMVMTWLCLIIFDLLINLKSYPSIIYRSNKTSWAVLYILIATASIVNIIETKSHSKTKEATTVKQYFETKNLAGYGGPINIAVTLDNDNKIQSLDLKENNETPYYIQDIDSFLNKFIGIDICDNAKISSVDAISGATVSSNAVSENLNNISTATEICSKATTAPKKISILKYKTLIIFISLTILSLILRPLFKISFIRMIFLGLIVVILGSVYKLQFSSIDIIKTLDIDFIGFNLSSMVIIITILFGRHYCAFLCPYGALQELSSKLKLKKIEISNCSTLKLNYFALLMLILAAVFYKVKFIEEPLTVFFGGSKNIIMIVSIIMILISTKLPRFWCRFLCPCGAFISSIANLSIRLDKLFYRSRQEAVKIAKRTVDQQASKSDKISTLLALLILIIIVSYNIKTKRENVKAAIPPKATVELSRIEQTNTKVEEKPKTDKIEKKNSTKPNPSPGLKSAPASLKFIIEKGHLSDRESMFYEKLD